MDKSCKTCRYLKNNNVCAFCEIKNCCVALNKWEAKMDKIQMSEEQAREMLKDAGYNDAYIGLGMQGLKKAGYIKQTVVDEAEEMFEEYQNLKNDNTCVIIYKQHEAIQYLKEQLYRGE